MRKQQWGGTISLRKSVAAATLSAAATIVSLAVLPGQAAAEEGVMAAAQPGSTIVYTRAQTKQIDRDFKASTATTAGINTTLGVLCTAAGGAGGPVAGTICAAQGAIVTISIASVVDRAAEAASTNQCLSINLAPNPRVSEGPPLPSVVNGASCLD